MKPICGSTILVGVLLTTLAISSSTVEAQETWPSELVGNDTWWNSREAFADPEDLSCGENHGIGLVMASGLYVDSVNLRCGSLDSDWEHSGIYLASASPAGGKADIYTSEEKSFRCDSGEVLAGFKGRAGDYLDRLQVGCRAPGEETVRWLLPAAGGTGGAEFDPVTCPSGMGVDRMSVWSMEAYGSAGLTYRWIPYSVTKLTFRCRTLPGTLPVQQVAGQLDYTVEQPLQPVGGQVDVAFREAPEAETPVAPAPSAPEAEAPVQDPAAPEPEPEPAPALNEEVSVPAPAESGELSVPAPEPAPAVTPRTPAPPPGVVSPRVGAPERANVPAPELPRPVDDATVEAAPPAVEDVAPPEAAAVPLGLELVLTPGSVRGGETARLTIRLTRAATIQEQVLLSSGAPELAQVPERATIEAGRQEIQVDVITTRPVERPTPVPIRASFGNGHEDPVEILLQVRPDPAGKGRPDTEETGQGRGRNEDQ